MSAARLAAILFVGVVIAAGPARAQGRSDSAPGQSNNAPGKTKTKSSGGSSSRATESGIASPVTASSSTSAPASAANAVIYYGSWLDDASVVAPGDVWIGLSTGYWSGQGNRQIDAPVASAAVGINRRLQAGGSFSFYHFRDPQGVSETGAGSMSVYGKLLLFDPSTTPKSIGLAITPLVELSPSAEQELGWALPVNLEVRRGASRFYGSAGYFSRGATFATVGVDVPVGSRLALTGSFGQSYATAGTHQTAFSAGTFFAVSSTTGAFVGLGQTLMPEAVGPGGISIAGGFSFLLPQPSHP